MDTDDLPPQNPLEAPTITEKMDTDDIAMVEETLEKKLEKEKEKSLSRIFDATWDEWCEGSHFAKDTMYMILEELIDRKNEKEFIAEVLNDMVRQHLVGEIKGPEIEEKNCPNKKLKSDFSTSDMETDVKEDESDQKSSHSVGTVTIFYLVKCYNRSTYELMRCKKDSILPMVQELVRNCKSQILKMAVNILINKYTILDDCKSSSTEISPLLKVMYDPDIDCISFLRDLIELTYVKNTKKFAFKKIFNQILSDMFMEMKTSPIRCIDKLPLNPLNKLYDLLEIQFEINQKVVRPICDLVVEHPTFCPQLCTNIPGREIARVSYLGPYLQVSILSDENPYFPIDDFCDESNVLLPMVQSNIQSKLEYIRSLLHKIFYVFILYKESRDIALKYISELLLHNAKRVQYNADERNSARDGFMLNLMAGKTSFVT